MIHTLKKRIKDLSEKEAKSLLLQFFIHMHRAEGANNPAQLAADLKELYAEFLKTSLDSFPQPNDKAVHIVFGASMAGSLRVALQELGLDTEEKIIGFSDLFSIGPIWHLQEEKGLVLRHEWLKDHLIQDEEYIHFYLEEMDHERLMVEMLPAEVPIIIWTGDNAHEQTAFRYMIDMLKNKPNPIALLNTSALYAQLFYRPDIDYQPLYSGEISPEKIKAIYKTNQEADILTKEEKALYADEWKELSAIHAVLRIWEDGAIRHVDEDFFDDFIIRAAQRLHQEADSYTFMPAARLIGEVLGHLDQYIGDEFLEYRVRQLIQKGIFGIKGVPKAMRFYSVRLNQR